MTEVSIEEKVRLAVEEIVDACYEPADVFDEFCLEMDKWLDERGLEAYIRVFWWDDFEELDQILDEVNHIRDRFNIREYAFWPSQEYRATFAVMAYRKQD